MCLAYKDIDDKVELNKKVAGNDEQYEVENSNLILIATICMSNRLQKDIAENVDLCKIFFLKIYKIV